MPEFPEIPAEIPIESVTGENAKLGIIGISAIVGGFAIGKAAADHARDKSTPPLLPEKMTVGQSVMTFAAGCVGLVLTGKMIKDAVDEYGVKTVGLTAVGITAAALVIRAVRS